MFNRSVNQVHPQKQDYLDILWDLFKEVHGVRPRGMYDNTWHIEDYVLSVACYKSGLMNKLSKNVLMKHVKCNYVWKLVRQTKLQLQDG